MQANINDNLNNNLNFNQEVVQSQNNIENVNEIENFKKFIEEYEESIKETLFKSLNNVKYFDRKNEKTVSEYKDIILNLLKIIKEKCINRLKKADAINIKNLLEGIKEEKISELEENINKYKKRGAFFYNYVKTDAYIIDQMKKLCEEFNSVLNYCENPNEYFIKAQEEAERKAKEQNEKNIPEKNKEKKSLNSINFYEEKNKEKKSYNTITRSAEESEKKQKQKINNEDLECAKIIEARIKYYEKMKMNKNKKKELINWFRDFDAKKNQEEERLKKLKKVKTDDFEIKTKKQIEQEKELEKQKQKEIEEYTKYLNRISAKTNLNTEELKERFYGLKADYNRDLITKRYNVINKCVNLAENKEKLKDLLQKRGIKIASLREMLKRRVKYDLKKENKFKFNIYGKCLEFNNVAEIFDYANKLHEKVIERFSFFKENTPRNPNNKLLKSDDLVFRALFKEILKKENEYLDVLVKLKKYLHYLRDMEFNFPENEKSDYNKIFKKDFEDVFIKYSMLNIVNLYENFLKHHPVDFNEFSQELLEKPELESKKTYEKVSIENYGKIKPIID